MCVQLIEGEIFMKQSVKQSVSKYADKSTSEIKHSYLFSTIYMFVQMIEGKSSWNSLWINMSVN